MRRLSLATLMACFVVPVGAQQAPPAPPPGPAPAQVRIVAPVTEGEVGQTVTFRVRGEDYETPPQTIVVVERPRVERIESMEERPSYLYYRENGEGLT